MSAEEDRIWTELVNEVDLDGNGEIDFYEFCHMMRKMIIENDWAQNFTLFSDGLLLTSKYLLTKI